MGVSLGVEVGDIVCLGLREKQNEQKGMQSLWQYIEMPEYRTHGRCLAIRQTTEASTRV